MQLIVPLIPIGILLLVVWNREPRNGLWFEPEQTPDQAKRNLLWGRIIFTVGIAAMYAGIAYQVLKPFQR